MYIDSGTQSYCAGKCGSKSNEIHPSRLVSSRLSLSLSCVYPGDPFFANSAFLQVQSEAELQHAYAMCQSDYRARCTVSCAHGFDVMVVISRYSTFYAWSTIFPVTVIVALSLLLFFIDPKMVELRLSSIIALILALTALQFIIQDYLPDSSYLTPVSKMIVLSYFLLLYEGFEALVVYWLVEYQFQVRHRIHTETDNNKEPEASSPRRNNIDEEDRAHSPMQQSRKRSTSIFACFDANNTNLSDREEYRAAFFIDLFSGVICALAFGIASGIFYS